MRLTVTIHPQEGCLPALFELGLNHRLMVSAVAIGDNEELAPPRSILEGVRAVRKAGILGRDEEFLEFAVAQNYVADRRDSPAENEQSLKLFIRSWCRVRSRSDLKYDLEAQARLDELIEEYNAWRRAKYQAQPDSTFDGLEL